jgi:hypothetical protein
MGYHMESLKWNLVIDHPLDGKLMPSTNWATGSIALGTG